MSKNSDYKVIMQDDVISLHSIEDIFSPNRSKSNSSFVNKNQQQKRFNEVHEYNIAVMGISQAGQTSLCKRLSKNTFSKTKHTTKQDKYVAYLESVNVKLNLYDLVGMRNQNIIEENQTVIRGSQYAFIVFSVVDPNWHQQVINWISFVKCVNKQCAIILIGNKTDLETNCVNYFDPFSKWNGINSLIKCSAQTGENLQQINNIQWIEEYDFEEIHGKC
ncbi:Rab1a [Hexamita inflata]|uniref:Rab1a n=1 Tax=Hexamita inflata TaxID=28002 RepID=A0AA86Q0D1_9EUKA|nr:Rab1a [Hexamita inflata]CAI9943084.1 Rab1a [Hexamita inflata]